MLPNAQSETYWLNLFAKHDLNNPQTLIETGGWQPVWDKIEALCRVDNFDNNFENATEKKIFLDIFFCSCLKHIEDSADGIILCQLIEKWLHLRKMPERYPALSSEEYGAAAYFCLKLREKIKNWLFLSSDAHLNAMPVQYHSMLHSLWPQLFFNIFSPLQMIDQKVLPEKIVPPGDWPQIGYPSLLAASMYFPDAAEKFAIDSENLIKADIPLFVKFTLIRWMVYIPYFNATNNDHRRLLKYAPDLCLALSNNLNSISQLIFINSVQEIMSGFWRVSYIGGNNIQALSSFGDFISSGINNFCRLPPPVNREIEPGQKIKIGYISRNFFQQAVSYYMINRIIHHDRGKFEVFVYALGDRHDSFTEIYAKNAGHFKKFTDLKNFNPIVENILRDGLDILIYPDIGMDVVTYILAGLRMAPLQCAMVGHGATTGLPTIDYYISGDFEPPNAEEQYREKLIRLSNLGAAQYLPEEPVTLISRTDLNIAEDAVVYISCANGIKHRPERDCLYIEILKKAANAWIILKPFTTKDGIDGKMAKRLRNLAIDAGVSERLIIMPSLDNYRSVLGLLKIADIQLDTYPYGGWTTNLEALYTGLPIVTQEGEFSRSRWGAGMLRALGITEGIAKNEEEYVEWAVNFARDSQLRQNISKVIKAKALDTFFNGRAAQKDFEDALFDILSQTNPYSFLNLSGNNKNALDDNGERKGGLIQKPAQNKVAITPKICVATSISPRNLPRQKECLSSWMDAGFRVISLNNPTEIERLKEEFPGVEFKTAKRDGKDKFRQPYMYFDDLLACLEDEKAVIGGIINSDIQLMPGVCNLGGVLCKTAKNSLVFGSRFDVDPAGYNFNDDAKEGKIYEFGFDYFFFDENLFAAFPKEDFCLGLPWWDYWAVLIPLKLGITARRLVTPAVSHILHEIAWDQETWFKLGGVLSKYVPPPSQVYQHEAVNMSAYLQYLAFKINKESRDIVL